MHYLTLHDNWSVRPLDTFSQGIYPRDTAGWIPTTVPSHWQQNPELERHAGKVVYRCDFSVPAPDTVMQARYWLRVNGAFYWSQPYFNGVDLGRHEGYFIPYECEITGWLQAENSLLMEVECFDEHTKYTKRMLTGVFSHWDVIDPLANPGGIWLPVELHRSGPVRLHAARLRTEALSERFAQLRFHLDIDSLVERIVTVRWTLTPKTFAGRSHVVEQRRELRAGTQEVSGLLKVQEPQLWWTHDLGSPDLYAVQVELFLDDEVSDRQEFAFGVRRFELRNWIPHLNGKRFLVKGNNYPPGDMRIATMTRERYDHDLELAKACYMNLLRVHAHIDHPALYDAADAAGVLLWQDMPLQWLYQPAVLPEARRQARAMARLLENHPSVAIYCMHNEPVFLTDTADETWFTRMRTSWHGFFFSWNRDVMDSQLKDVVERQDPTRPVVRSSGEFEMPLIREGTDAHAYFGWYKTYGPLRELDKNIQRFNNHMRFVTEFGAQSFPNLESSLKFMDADLAKLDVEHLVQRHGFQADILQNWVDWRAAKSLAELIELTQTYQSYINRFYIDRLRFHKYRPTGGIVPFILVDPHPAISWSVIDYWRVPKRSYDALRQAFSPQYAFTIHRADPFRVAEPIELPIYVVNDAHESHPGLRLEAELFSPDGSQLARITHHLSLGADCPSQEIDRVRLTPSQPGHYQLHIRLYGIAEPFANIYNLIVVG
jgi:beta-mannosidase